MLITHTSIPKILTTQNTMWIFLVAFTLHNLEELSRLSTYAKAHISMYRLPGPLVDMMSISTAEFGMSVLIVTVLAALLTFMAVKNSIQGSWMLIYMGFSCTMLINVLGHVVQSLLFYEFTPGVITAVLLLLPLIIYLIYRYCIEKRATPKTLALLTVAGALLMIPLIWLLLMIGKILARDHSSSYFLLEPLALSTGYFCSFFAILS